MKRIEIENGEVRNGYEIDELETEPKLKAINEHIEFIIETMDEESPYYDAVEEAERLQTPWFLGQIIWDNHSEQVLEDIKINDYLYDEDGNTLPLQYHIRNNEVVKTLWNDKHEVTITEV